MRLLPNLKLGVRIVSHLLKSRASSGTGVRGATPRDTFPEPPETTPCPQGKSGTESSSITSHCYLERNKLTNGYGYCSLCFDWVDRSTEQKPIIK